MNTELLTKPSPELKQHAQDLRRDAGLVGQDVKNQAAAGFQEVKKEAQTRLEDARGVVADFQDLAKSFAREHPFGLFAAGIVAGIVVAGFRRK